MANIMHIKGQLLELFKGCTIQLIYLYDLQIHRKPSFIIYERYNAAHNIINEKNNTAPTSIEVNNIKRIDVNAIVPVTISIDSDNEIISDTIKKYNSIMYNRKFCIALLNTLLSINICFANYFDIQIDILNIINNSYLLTSEFINKLVNILAQFIKINIDDTPIIRIAKNIRMFKEDNIKYILANCITVVATCNILAIRVFDKIGISQDNVIVQFVGQIGLIFKEISKKIETDEYNSSGLEQIDKLIKLKQQLFYGTHYNFFKLLPECKTYFFPKEEEKCNFYNINSNEFEYTVSKENNISVILQNNTKIKKIFRKLNNHCDYIRFLSEFHRLFTEDIIDIKNIDTQKIDTAKQLLELYVDIINQINGRLQDSQTDIDTKSVQLLFNKLLELCSKYLTEYNNFFEKSNLSLKKNTSVLDKYRAKLDKYRAKLDKYTKSFNQGKNTTDFSEYVIIFIKLMKFAFKIYNLREIIVNYSETNTPNIRNEYNGTRNNITKLTMKVGAMYNESRKKTFQALTHKPTVPKKPSIHRAATRRITRFQPKNVTLYNPKQTPSIIPSLKKLTSYNTIESNTNNRNAPLPAPLPPLHEQKTKKKGLFKRVKSKFAKIANVFRKKTKKPSSRKISIVPLTPNPMYEGSHSQNMQNIKKNPTYESVKSHRTPTTYASLNFNTNSRKNPPLRNITTYTEIRKPSTKEIIGSTSVKTIPTYAKGRHPPPLPPRAVTQRTTPPLTTSSSQKKQSHSSSRVKVASNTKKIKNNEKIGKAKFKNLKAIFEKQVKKSSIVPRPLRIRSGTVA